MVKENLTSKNGLAGTARTAQPKSPGSAFAAAVIGMSWQLALVVLVPIIGGFKLDQHLHSVPLWTVVGFVLAMAGMAMVVWRQLQLFSTSGDTTVDTTADSSALPRSGKGSHS